MADRVRLYPRAARNASSAALMVVGLLALYNWVLSPHVRYLHAMQRFGSAVTRVAEESDRISSSLDAKVAQWRTLQREMAEMNESLFTADTAEAFVRGLLALVEETGCTVVLADFTGSAKAEPIGEPNAPIALAVSHLELAASGQPDQIVALLERLENHRPRVSIDSCQCDFPEGEAGRIECNLVLTTYVVTQR